MKNYRMIGILVLTCLLAVVVIQNRNQVQTHFLFITIEMPHILLLLLTAGVGFVLGFLVRRSK